MIFQTLDPFVIFSFHHGISLVSSVFKTLQLCISPVLPEGRPRDYRMTNFDLPRRLSEQIILKLTTTNSIPAENKGDYFNSETKTKHDKKVKVDSIILAVYVYHNLKRIFPYVYQ